MYTRRNFVKDAALLSAALLAGNNLYAAGKKQAIGLQLYTLRKVLTSKNVDGIMGRIAALGYKEIEMFGYSLRDKFWGMDPKAFKKLLKENKLTAPSAHIAFDNFLSGKDENELRLTCEAAAAAGNKFLVVAWIPEIYRTTINDYKLLAAKLEKASGIAGQYGLGFAYHNHDFEFKPLENDVTGYDIILKETSADRVKMELDLYWSVKAGIDPIQLFEAYPGRFPLWHVKDMDKVSGSFTEVGAGTIDFKKIFQHKKTAGLQHFFIEQDEVNKDVFVSIQESFDYASKNLVAE